MLFWTLASCLALVCTLWMASPFLQRRSIEMDDAEGTISVFRDQQSEVDRDLEPIPFYKSPKYGFANSLRIVV